MAAVFAFDTIDSIRDQTYPKAPKTVGKLEKALQAKKIPQGLISKFVKDLKSYNFSPITSEADRYIMKNMVATEFVYNYVRDKRTVGAIREFPERGLVEVAEPIGVIFSLIPITNPTSTVLFKCVMAIKTRNAVIFSPHPSAWRCCSEAVKMMYEAAVEHGAPEGVFSCLESHTLEDNAYLMRHKEVALIDATGGPSAVKAFGSSIRAASL